MKKKQNEQFSVTLTFKPMKGFGGGFRQEWISAEGNGVTAGLDSGGGLGNPYLTFWIKPDGSERIYYTAHMGKVFTDAIDQARAALRQAGR